MKPTVVAELIDHTNSKWIEEKVRECFEEEDAEAILTIPLSERRPPDKLIWRVTKNGKFTVRSAYHLAISKFSKRGTDIPSTSTDNKIWKTLRSINVPPSTRHFLWRACTNALPTKEGLCKRGIDVNPLCEMCGEEVETLKHTLLLCPVAIHSWGQTPIRIDTLVAMSLSLKNFC